MTKLRSPLSVRLDPGLARVLERHCAQTGETRSRVVQQSVAQYLIERSGPTLGGLAEALLPPLAAAAPGRRAGARRQKRYRDYVREKRRR